MRHHLPSMSEQFQLFANGAELCSACTEFNDPKVYKDLSRVSQSDVQSGEDEAIVHEKD